MSGTTFSTYPVQSQNATHAAPRSGAAQAASVEQSYLAASAQYTTPAPTAPAATPYEPGPGMTTLALGEEDGGAASMPHTETMPPPPSHDGGGFQVTTLAIGEEDGGAVGGGGGGYGSMSPIRDDHAAIGGMQGGMRGGDHGAQSLPASHPVPQGGYGMMQPIYSPGEPEYPAFAQTSQTTDLLNFHPVARVPRTALPQSMPVAAPAPVAVPAPVTAQPMQAAPAPVGMLAQDVPQSGSYESVGSYEDYVGGGTAIPAYAPAQVPMEAAPAAPAYESFVPSYESIETPAYTPAPAPAYEAVPAPYEPAPAPVAAYGAAPVESAPPAASPAPLTSTEPRTKPASLGKDAPFGGTGGVDAVDPGDGNPGYVPSSGGATQAPAPAAPEATYVEVSIDDYLVEAPGTREAAPAAAPPLARDGAEAPAAPPAPVAPAPAPPGEAASQPRSSLGGSFVVIDSAPPASVTAPPSGVSSGAGVGGPDAAAEPAMPGEDLRIITLSAGEENGSP